MHTVGFRGRNFRVNIQAVSDPVPNESDVVVIAVQVGKVGRRVSLGPDLSLLQAVHRTDCLLKITDNTEVVRSCCMQP
jgi:hypothetical protein